MFKRNPEAKAQKEAEKAERLARMSSERDAKAAAKAEKNAQEAKAKAAEEKAKAEARAASLAGSLFVSTPCYDSVWTYVVVFPDRIEERRRDDSVGKVCFLRSVSGVKRGQLSGIVEVSTGARDPEQFTCKGKDEADQMVAVVTSTMANLP